MHVRIINALMKSNPTRWLNLCSSSMCLLHPGPTLSPKQNLHSWKSMTSIKMLVMLYNWMVLLKVLKTQDKGEVRQKFLDMIHRLLLQVPYHQLLVICWKTEIKCVFRRRRHSWCTRLWRAQAASGFPSMGSQFSRFPPFPSSLSSAQCACRSIWIWMNFTKSCRIMGSYNLSGTWWTAQRTFFGNSNSLQIRPFPLHISFFPFANEVFHWQMKFFSMKTRFFLCKLSFFLCK